MKQALSYKATFALGNSSIRTVQQCSRIEFIERHRAFLHGQHTVHLTLSHRHLTRTALGQRRGTDTDSATIVVRTLGGDTHLGGQREVLVAVDNPYT